MSMSEPSKAAMDAAKTWKRTTGNFRALAQIIDDFMAPEREELAQLRQWRESVRGKAEGFVIAADKMAQEMLPRYSINSSEHPLTAIRRSWKEEREAAERLKPIFDRFKERHGKDYLKRLPLWRDHLSDDENCILDYLIAIERARHG